MAEPSQVTAIREDAVSSRATSFHGRVGMQLQPERYVDDTCVVTGDRHEYDSFY